MSYTYLFVNFDIMFQRMGHPDLWKWPPTLTWEDGVCTLRVSARGRVGGQCGQAEPGMMRWDDAMMMWYEYEPGMMSWWYDDKCGMRQVWWGDESSYKPEKCYQWQWPPNVCMSARITALALPPPQLAPALCPSSYFHLLRCLETVFLINVIKIQ